MRKPVTLEMQRIYATRWKNKNPWSRTYQTIWSRCNGKTHKTYRFYGGAGIKLIISHEELKQLWFRDKAYEMKHPSIDRIDSKGHYEINNCRYIEMEENRKRANEVRKENLRKKKERLYATSEGGK